MLTLHKPKCKSYDITTITTSSKTHLHWKNQFHKIPLYFRIYAYFEAEIINDNSTIGNKTTNIYKQKPVLNGYYMESEMDDILKSGYFTSPLGYENVDWFVDEVEE